MPQSTSGGAGLPIGAKGVVVSVGSSLAFGLIYFLTPLLHPMSGETVWAIRALVTLPFVTVVLLAARDWSLASAIASRVKLRPMLLLGIVTSSALLSVQLWLFAWAPLNGRAMQVALGYFLLPLVLVVLGRLLYKDRMTWWQWLAAGVALLGVGYEVLRIGGMSWETLVVALGYPAYFVLRRSMGTNHLGGMWWEFICMLPFAAVIAIVSFADGSLLEQNPALWWSAPGIAAISAFALLLYLLASRMLSMSLFGLLSYVEPAMLLIASLLLGERITGDEWFTYLAIWAAVLVLVGGGLTRLGRGPVGSPPQ